MKLLSSKFFIFVFVLLLPVFGGCGSKHLKGLVPGSGQLLLDDKPLDEAIVTFIPMGGGKPAAGITDATGNFRLTTRDPNDGVFPGEYHVAVSKLEVLHMPTEEENEAHRARTGEYLQTKVRIIVPERYNMPQTSQLEYTIPPKGAKDIIITVKSK